MTDKELIAERTVFAVGADSRRLEIRLMIGKPYPVGPDEWACPAALFGLHGTFPDMHGVDSWQALMSARQLLNDLLTYFVEDGGKLYWEDGGEEMTVDELFSYRREVPSPNEPLTPQQIQRIEKLTPRELERIDETIMSHVTKQWRKMALIVGLAMKDNSDLIRNLPDAFYAERVRLLVKGRRLESQGNIDFMRFSEVRLPS